MGCEIFVGRLWWLHTLNQSAHALLHMRARVLLKLKMYASIQDAPTSLTKFSAWMTCRSAGDCGSEVPGTVILSSTAEVFPLVADLSGRCCRPLSPLVCPPALSFGLRESPLHRHRPLKHCTFDCGRGGYLYTYKLRYLHICTICVYIHTRDIYLVHVRTHTHTLNLFACAPWMVLDE